MIIMLLLLLGSSVVLNLIILRKYWDMSTRFALQVKHCVMPAILEQENAQLPLKLILKLESIKYRSLSQAENALRIFHNRQPKIQQVYHNQRRKCLERNRRVVAPVPHGINAEIGGIRTFFERWNEELFQH